MQLLCLTATNVRCHEHARLDCASNVTILSGPNGSGKTSLLEAVNVCAMTRTFVPVADGSLIRQGAEVSHLTIEARTDLGTLYKATAELRVGQRKRFTTSVSDHPTAKDMIGEFPVVALCPDHKSITFGGPSERRAFIDALMAQSSRSVSELLFEHRRLLKQRNAGLAADPPVGNDVLEVWTTAFVEASARLVERRRDFIADLTPLVREEYAGVAGDRERIDLVYEADNVADGSGSVMEQLAQAAHRLASAERVRATTLFGPQKDEIHCLLNGRSVRECASQGQHKSLLVALKLAEARLVYERRNERPVVLLDDVFSELDEQRASRVLARVAELGLQCLVTTTDGERVLQHVQQHLANGVACVQVPADVETLGENTKVAA